MSAKFGQGERPDEITEPLLFAEDGWSWAWILSGPLFCVGAGLFEWVTGAQVHWLMLTICGIGTALCHGVMIAATRIHGRLRLTATRLIQGTEELPIVGIAEVLPPAVETEGRFGGRGTIEESWHSARTLGELRDVPRRRTAVGLRLSSGAEVRAWARDANGLREALTPLVSCSPPGVMPPGATSEEGEGK